MAADRLREADYCRSQTLLEVVRIGKGMDLLAVHGVLTRAEFDGS